MRKKKISVVDEEIYTETLENGLRVIVCPKETNHTFFSTIVNYGGMNNEFIPLGEKKYAQYPTGIAHYIEHQIHNSKEGEETIFELFAKSGVDYNATTNPVKTDYHFSCVDNFYENMRYLLDNIFSPNFTDESVEKERKIILREYYMGRDNPYNRMYQTILKNLIKENPYKNLVLGTEEDIKKITKEDLYVSYETFYRPSNMFCVVVGNVDPDVVTRELEEYFKDKDFSDEPLQSKKIKEDKKVFKREEEIDMDVHTNLCVYGIKLPLLGKTNKEILKEKLYFRLLLAAMFTVTSSECNKLKDTGMFSDLGFDVFRVDDYIYLIFDIESEKPEEMINEIKRMLLEMNLKKEDIERKRHKLIAGILKGYDNIDYIQGDLVSDIVLYDEIMYDYFDILKSIKYEDIKKYVKKLKFNNESIVIIRK